MVYLLHVVVFSSFFVSSHSLSCIQCNPRNENYMPDAELTEYSTRCETGAFNVSECANRTHTHCIVDFFSRDTDPVRRVIARKCGTISDVKGCMLINQQKKPRNHRHSLRYIEMCSMACPDGRCVNASNGGPQAIVVVLTLMFLVWKN